MDPRMHHAMAAIAVLVDAVEDGALRGDPEAEHASRMLKLAKGFDMLLDLLPGQPLRDRAKFLLLGQKPIALREKPLQIQNFFLPLQLLLL